MQNQGNRFKHKACNLCWIMPPTLGALIKDIKGPTVRNFQNRSQACINRMADFYKRFSCVKKVWQLVQRDF